jgi:hypothetical protein
MVVVFSPFIKAELSLHDYGQRRPFVPKFTPLLIPRFMNVLQYLDLLIWTKIIKTVDKVLTDKRTVKIIILRHECLGLILVCTCHVGKISGDQQSKSHQHWYSY